MFTRATLDRGIASYITLAAPGFVEGDVTSYVST
jgi:hypothetical protein